ncbi:MAG: 2-succinyl-5-enolpyruvyl-6-hydroxy-3-cyclohexene-1-carboxylic-acid synthase, partial [Enterobacteriaceae bacterium]
MPTSTFNRLWASLLLEGLSRHGVHHVCIAPGSRSTPLTLAAAANRKLVCHTHFDERGLGHLALGLAKSTGSPVAVIVTSGTAVANLYPAVIEAGLTGERLILLTADRPPELINCGANQAIQQEGIFATHPAFSLNLPRPCAEISAAWLVSTLDDAMHQTRYGALHINCPFAEPLYGDMDASEAEWSATLGSWWQEDKPWLRYKEGTVCPRVDDWPFWQQKRGVIIAGQMSAEEGRSLAQWAAILGWPLLADALSQTGQPLPCADLWLSHPQAQQILQQTQLVIQFGGRLTGKRLLEWQAACQPQEYWLISETPGRLDSANHRGRRIICCIQQWLSLHRVHPHTPWAPQLQERALRTLHYVQAQTAEQFGEIALFSHLGQLLPVRGQLFIGNSLPIRLLDAVTQLPVGYPVYSNRGASGIDGLIATMAGVQRGNGKETLAIVGDISALYDLNSLMLLRQCSAPLVLIVVNNDGGSIFSLFPLCEQEKQRYYLMPHGLDFASAAQQFALRYECPENWQQLQEIVQHTWLHGGVVVVELKVPSQQAVTTWQRMRQQLTGG